MKKYEYQDLANMFIQGMVSNNFQANESDYIYLKFDVSRETIVEDTLNHLIKEDVNLKKQLRVSFKGEFGQDEGGVQKEFFQILVRDLFKPEYAMFTYHPESKLVWFNGNTCESNLKFELIGALMGLAIYNQIILDIHFPVVCYKKLLDIKPNFNDLMELKPEVAKSLDYILKSDSPNLESELYLTFSYDYDYFGENRTEELKEGGEKIFVNQDNKHEYVDLLIETIFNRSIRNQFNSFYKGFHKVCGGDALNLFRPEELQLLICGCKVLDFAGMKRETRYEGYEGDEEVIEWFWDILLNELNHQQQKRFLFFCTGCDKAPVSGLENICFIIMRHGDEDDKLP
jgi:ubiquitin-protein ligase E3 A